VETSYNSAYTEIWYTQLGKVYMTGGTTPYYAYWPTPGNGTVEVNGNAATNFYMHKDWLGNSRISSTLINHTVVSDQAYAPYGEVYDKLATGAGVPGQMFTGDTQDILTGIFDTPNRELNASQGRWLSPDPALQGWNQYAYVNGNPMSNVDPSGLACYPLERAMTGSCEGFMSNGVSFGASWNEFDVMNIPIKQLIGYQSTRYIDPSTWQVIQTSLSPLYQQVGTGFDISSDSGNGGPANNGSWAWNFTKSFFTGFSVFGPKSDPRPSCFGQFLADAGSGFVNSFLPPSPSPGEIVGVGTAMYDYSNEVGIVAEQHLAQYGSRISKYTIGEQAGARAGLAGLLANADYQGAVALVNEYGSASSGQCK
jgi:RHS repeat-associated protein